MGKTREAALGKTREAAATKAQALAPSRFQKTKRPRQKRGRFEIIMLWIPNGPVTLVAGLIIQILRAFVFLNCVAAVHHQGFTCYVGRLP